MHKLPVHWKVPLASMRVNTFEHGTVLHRRTTHTYSLTGLYSNVP